MSLSINTNLSAMTAVAAVEQSDQSLQTSIQRLSTGLRINSPQDDPAGFIISQGLKSQIAGLSNASQNTQNAINLAKTAGGAMTQIAGLLTTLRTLALNSANAAVADANTLQANQAQAASIIASIDQIANATQFGSQPLLNGAAGVRASITDGGDINALYLGNTVGGYQIQSGPVTVQKVSQATEAQVTTSQTFASANSTIPSGGVLAVNGQAFQVNAGETVQSLVAGLNAASATTGVTAAIVAVGAQVSVQFTQNRYGSQYGISIIDSGNILDASSPVTASGTDGVFNVSATTTQGVQTVQFTGGRSAGATGLQLSDGAGNSLTLSTAGNAGLAAPTAVGTVTVGSMQFQVGANAAQSVSYSLPSMLSADLGTGVISGQSIASVDLSSPASANTALQVIDGALTQVGGAEGQLGAFQAQTLQSAATLADVATQNFTAASSTIADADIATETTNFTKNQVMQQSGLAMLAQANQNPAQLLALLKNL